MNHAAFLLLESVVLWILSWSLFVTYGSWLWAPSFFAGILCFGLAARVFWVESRGLR